MTRYYTLKVVEPRWLGSILIRIALFFGDRNGYLTSSATNVIDTVIENKVLQRVLCAQWYVLYLLRDINYVTQISPFLT
jgi:hypothetical protein